MAFMVQDIQFLSAWHVETTSGNECVPHDVAGVTGLSCDLTLKACLPYLYGEPLKPDPKLFGDGIEDRTGWYARLSAPGYTDRLTEWSGPFDTKAKARKHLIEMYGDLQENEGD